MVSVPGQVVATGIYSGEASDVLSPPGRGQTSRTQASPKRVRPCGEAVNFLPQEPSKFEIRASDGNTWLALLLLSANERFLIHATPRVLAHDAFEPI
jgi:hypothetical protein